MKSIHHPAYISLVDELVLSRKKQKLTQQKVADILGKPQSFVAKIEGCERKVDILEFILWCKALNCQPELLLSQVSEQVV